MSTPTPCDVRLGATEAGEVLLLLDDEESLRMTWMEALSIGIGLCGWGGVAAAAVGADAGTIRAVQEKARAAVTADVLGDAQ